MAIQILRFTGIDIDDISRQGPEFKAKEKKIYSFPESFETLTDWIKLSYQGAKCLKCKAELTTTPLFMPLYIDSTGGTPTIGIKGPLCCNKCVEDFIKLFSRNPDDEWHYLSLFDYLKKQILVSPYKNYFRI